MKTNLRGKNKEKWMMTREGGRWARVPPCVSAIHLMFILIKSSFTALNFVEMLISSLDWWMIKTDAIWHIIQCSFDLLACLDVARFFGSILTATFNFIDSLLHPVVQKKKKTQNCSARALLVIHWRSNHVAPCLLHNILHKKIQ